MSVFVVPKNLFLRTYSVFSTQTPTLIGCNLLTIHQLGSLATSPFCPAAISEALNYDTVSCLLTQESEEIFSTYSPHQPTRCTESCCLCRERDSISAFARLASLAKKFPGTGRTPDRKVRAQSARTAPQDGTTAVMANAWWQEVAILTQAKHDAI